MAFSLAFLPLLAAPGTEELKCRTRSLLTLPALYLAQVDPWKTTQGAVKGLRISLPLGLRPDGAWNTDTIVLVRTSAKYIHLKEKRSEMALPAPAHPETSERQTREGAKRSHPRGLPRAADEAQMEPLLRRAEQKQAPTGAYAVGSRCHRWREHRRRHHAGG